MLLEKAGMKMGDIDIVKPISTQSWNYRSVWFRDPDGNIINFYQDLNTDQPQTVCDTHPTES